MTDPQPADTQGTGAEERAEERAVVFVELRRLAEAATAGPWRVGFGDGSGAEPDCAWIVTAMDKAIVGGGEVFGLAVGVLDGDNAAHIAAMHPQQTLALLNLLAQHAEREIALGLEIKALRDDLTAADERERELVGALRDLRAALTPFLTAAARARHYGSPRAHEHVVTDTNGHQHQLHAVDHDLSPGKPRDELLTMAHFFALADAAEAALSRAGATP